MNKAFHVVELSVKLANVGVLDGARATPDPALTGNVAGEVMQPLDQHMPAAVLGIRAAAIVVAVV